MINLTKNSYLDLENGLTGYKAHKTMFFSSQVKMGRPFKKRTRSRLFSYRSLKWSCPVTEKDVRLVEPHKFGIQAAGGGK